MKYYDAALICLNGHIINSSTNKSPEDNKKFCDKCGSETITKCPRCKTEIQGDYEERQEDEFTYLPNRSYTIHMSEKAPAFCHNCGKPYPWTESKLKAADELADEIENLKPEEKDVLKKSLDDLIKDSPNAQVAALRFKKLIAKAGGTVGNFFKDLLVDVLSEAIKKSIWGA